MVVEEVPASFLNAPGVGVKRPRERTTQPAAAAAEVRPALDADPAEAFHRPMDKVGRGTPSTTSSSSSPQHPTERPPSLLPAPPSSRSARDTPPPCSQGTFTHWMFRNSVEVSLQTGCLHRSYDGHCR